MVQLNCSFLMKLRIQEYPQALKEICSIYDEEQIEELHLKESLSRLKSHSADLDFVWEMRNPHPLTVVLQENNKIRRDYLVGMRGRVKAILKSPDAAEKAAARTLYLWMNKHRQHFYSVSSIIQSRLVDNLSTEMMVSEEISEAMTTLGLTGVFDAIVSLSSQIVRNVTKRHDETKKNMSKVDRIKRASYADLVKFMQSLKTAINLEDPSVGFYADYEVKIETRLDKYRTRLLSRATRRATMEMENDESEVVVDENVDSNEVLGLMKLAKNGNAINGELMEAAHFGVKNGSDQVNENHV